MARFTQGPWDETGGYDCITPGIDIFDHGEKKLTIDGMNFGWDTGSVVDMIEHNQQVQRRMQVFAFKLVRLLNEDAEGR